MINQRVQWKTNCVSEQAFVFSFQYAECLHGHLNCPVHQSPHGTTPPSTCSLHGTKMERSDWAGMSVSPNGLVGDEELVQGWVVVNPDLLLLEGK